MKTAKVFQYGDSQAVRLPKEFRFADDEVIVKHHAGGVLLLPRQYDPKDLLAIVGRFQSPFDAGDDPVPQPRDF